MDTSGPFESSEKKISRKKALSPQPRSSSREAAGEYSLGPWPQDNQQRTKAQAHGRFRRVTVHASTPAVGLAPAEARLVATAGFPENHPASVGLVPAGRRLRGRSRALAGSRPPAGTSPAERMRELP
jgi:hypothetical protein